MSNAGDGNLISRIIAEFKHAPLGATYYLFAILAVSYTFITGVVTYLKATDLKAVDYFQYVAVVIKLGIGLIIPLLLVRVLQSGRSDAPLLLNNNWESVKSTFDMKVWKNKRLVVRTDKLKALSATKVFNYRFFLTGSNTFKATLTSPTTAKLCGPVYDHEYILYQVELEREYKDNETVELCLQYEVDDPSSSMKPFAALAANNLRSYNQVEHKISFPADKPKDVKFEVKNINTGAVVGGSINQLFPNPDGTYNHALLNLTQSNRYVFSWSW
jgi:hypothetical protein